MHVVMVSKAVVTGAYQRKLEELARLPGITLTALVPPSWRDSRGTTKLERSYVSGYRLIETPLMFNGHFHLHFYPQLGRLLRELRPDLLHIDEEPCNTATVHATWLAQRQGIAVCFFSWQNLYRRYPAPFSWFERYTFEHAAHGLAGSAEAAAVLRRKGYRGPITEVPQFGVDPAVFAPQAASLAAQKSFFTIGYAGGLVPEKGVDLLLTAVAGVAGSRLKLAGDGDQRLRLERLANSLGLGARVEFIPRLPSTAMPDFYRTLDTLVLPSRTTASWKEQFGRVLIEAMACGVPVVGARSGEIPQVIGEAGLIFAEGDVAGLREHLVRLQADGALRRDLAQRGRARVVAHFTQARVAALTYAAYRQAIAAKSSQAPRYAVGGV